MAVDPEPTRVRVVAPHAIPERAPIEIYPGDTVKVGERDTTWPAFVFITSTQGEGWVPARHLETDSGETVVVTGYDTTELPTEAGQELVVVKRDDESGWLWCRRDDGDEGWVPSSTVEVIS